MNIVVLSVEIGTISQSFTEDACWTEPISFALSSGSRDGHNKNQNST
ncbi:unnamed protein product, partial [Adineta steineri]